MVKFICDYCGKDIEGYKGFDLDNIYNINIEGDYMEITIKINSNNSHLHNNCIKELVNKFIDTDNWKNTIRKVVA